MEALHERGWPLSRVTCVCARTHTQHFRRAHSLVHKLYAEGRYCARRLQLRLTSLVARMRSRNAMRAVTVAAVATH